MYVKVFKRLLDIILSAIGLLVVAIPLLIVALIIYCEDPGPVIFTQQRVGLHKEPFNLYKLRSMRLDAPHDMPTHMFTNPEQYILKVGKFIRKTSIDELPQLWNILKGDISLIGPRPVLQKQTDLIDEREQYGANDIKPGLTGWAQINGRDKLENPIKARLDGEYAAALYSGHGLQMDWKCFWRTVVYVLRGDGVIEGGTGRLHDQEEAQADPSVEKELVVK